MRKTLLIVVPVYFIAYIFVTREFFQSGNYQLLRSILYNLSPLVSVLGGLYAIKTFGFKGTRAHGLMLLTGGLSFWLIGEITYNIFTNLGMTAFPSIADLFYFLAYPFLFLGLIFEYRLAEVKVKNISKPLLLSLAGLGVVLTACVFYFGIYLAYNPEVPVIENIFSMGYGVADLALVMFSALLAVVVWEYRKGTIVTAWMCFLLAMIFTLIPDIIFAIFNSKYDVEFSLTLLMDMLWMISYFLFAATFMQLVANVEKIKIRLSNGDLH